jgi:glycosyltransferase involved in cell wall biosynthesis
MKLAIVVQRYGEDISGGAELHARYIAERLASRTEVRVLTTCARDHVTWRNEFAEGLDDVRGIPVERFRVSRERSLSELGIRSRRVFLRLHSIQEELEWLESEGPLSPGLVTRLRRARGEFDFVVLFCARYYHAYHGARAVHDRAVLVPTAERDPALGLAIFQPMFRGVRAIMYNSFEERAAIQAVSGNSHVPGVVVGVGSEIPADVTPARARQTFQLSNPFLLYIGRIDPDKGCGELFDFFIRYASDTPRALDLVLIGTPTMPIPAHPRIRHLGFLTDRDKFDVLAAAAILIMPSFYESLSMAALEAWALGRPVLANARCDVLLGQCLRSHAGLYYEDSADFAAAIDRLLDDPALAASLGRNGRTYFARHYSWPVIERKYLDMFDRLTSDTTPRSMEPLPGWFVRRRATVPAAVDVVAGLPSGPAVPRDETVEVSA